jgi:alanyl aminopeptidase
VQYDRQEAPHTKCILMSGRDAVLELEGAPCPAWVLPNAEGAGYYRWSLPARWNEKVVAAPLSLTGRLNVADNVRAAFTAGRISAEDAIRSLAPFASADERAIATVPMEVLRFAGERLVPEDLSAAGRSYSAGLYGDVYRRLGFDPRPGEDDDTRLLRRDVIEFLALEAMDPDVRKEADARGRALAGYPAGGRLDPGAVDENLAEVSLSVALQVNGKPFLNALVDLLGKTTDTIERDHILSAIGSSTDPVLAPDVLALTFHRALRVSESVLPVFYQVRHPETRAQAWQWFRTNFDRLMRRIPASERAFLPLAARRFCSDAEAEEVRRFFEPRMPQLPGASATLAESLESIRLCAARVRAQSESARNFFLSPQ